MEKISSENQEVFPMGDFNNDLMKTEEDNDINKFYNIFVSHITLPARIILQV